MSRIEALQGELQGTQGQLQSDPDRARQVVGSQAAHHGAGGDSRAADAGLGRPAPGPGRIPRAPHHGRGRPAPPQAPQHPAEGGLSPPVAGRTAPMVRRRRQAGSTPVQAGHEGHREEAGAMPRLRPHGLRREAGLVRPTGADRRPVPGNLEDHQRTSGHQGSQPARAGAGAGGAGASATCLVSGTPSAAAAACRSKPLASAAKLTDPI